MAKLIPHYVQSFMTSAMMSYAIPMNTEVYLLRGKEDKTPILLEAPAGKIRVKTKGISEMYISIPDGFDETSVCVTFDEYTF